MSSNHAQNPLRWERRSQYSSNRYSQGPPLPPAPASPRSPRRSRETKRYSSPSHRPSRDKNSLTVRLRKHFTAAMAEFVGTVLFLWFAFAFHQVVATNSTGAPASTTVVYIALAYGFSLLVNAWGFYRISGGLFNPAVSLGMVLAGQLPAIRGLWLVPAEILGGIVAAALVSCMFPGDIAVVNTNLGAGTSVVRGVFIEMFLTSLLIFTILMLAAEKSKVTFMAPLGIGLALFVAELAGVLYTGGSLNPARSFGPAVASRSFPHYHWIYWVGPFLGSLLTAGYYRFVKWLGYEDVNPAQDSAGGDFQGGKPQGEV